MKPRLVIGIAIIGLGCLVGCSPSAEVLKNGRKTDALIVCEDFAKRRLRAPSTAKFDHEGSIDQAVTDLGAGHFRVIGYFDAQNGFGAMLRSDYVCDVQHTTGDSYNLIAVTARERK